MGVGAMIRISDFQMKDVINVANGKKLGNVGDIDINVTNGKINAVIIGGAGKVLGFFGRDEDIVIPWKNILKIGEDVILVRYQSENMMKDVEEDE